MLVRTSKVKKKNKTKTLLEVMNVLCYLPDTY